MIRSKVHGKGYFSEARHNCFFCGENLALTLDSKSEQGYLLMQKKLAKFWCSRFATVIRLINDSNYVLESIKNSN